ncbi:hypothetical protein JOE09_003603 [Pantoea coffeiphila]|nr:hypothetical protein [Pantoea coffeiphila]
MGRRKDFGKYLFVTWHNRLYLVSMKGVVLGVQD